MAKKIRLWKLETQSRKYESERFTYTVNAWTIDQAIKKVNKQKQNTEYIYEVELIATED